MLMLIVVVHVHFYCFSIVDRWFHTRSMNIIFLQYDTCIDWIVDPLHLCCCMSNWCLICIQMRISIRLNSLFSFLFSRIKRKTNKNNKPYSYNESWYFVVHKYTNVGRSTLSMYPFFYKFQGNPHKCKDRKCKNMISSQIASI